MWIARLCRNDILFAIAALSTKIANPDSLQLYAYIDASYALHYDAKGQTGIIISMGKTGPPVFCKSEVIWAKQFMESLGFQQKMITIFEDNQSSIILANKSRGTTISRTKHQRKI